jgi:cell division septation protein DedD
VTSPGDLQPTIAASSGVPDTSASEPRKKHIPIVSIPAIISIGLVIAAVYLVSRIVTAHRPAAVSHNVSAAIKPAVAPPPVATPAAEIPIAKATAVIRKETAVIRKETTTEPKPVRQPAEVSKAVAREDAIPMIAPKTGERYIQIGALDEDATRRFVRKLRDAKMEPHVAPASKPELLRILIGPFESRDALNATKAQLELEGLATLVRQY